MVSTAPVRRKSPASKSKATLTRLAFETSRELDFLSEKELTAQTGHQPREWPLVALKELLDNALDACEESGIAPVIHVAVDEKGLTVADNGPGIPASVIEGVTNFAIRVSSREAYVAPDRGRQGNALKTILAMPFVLSQGGAGAVAVESQGVRHEIGVLVDRIRQKPKIEHSRSKSRRKPGTSITVPWPNSPRSEAQGEDDGFLQNEGEDQERLREWSDRLHASLNRVRAACGKEPLPDQAPAEPATTSTLLDAKDRFLQLADDFTWTNPHLSLTVDWLGERAETPATDPNWQKWKPCDPTDPHWYGVDEFERLIAAHIAYDAEHQRDSTVRELVTAFRGLTSTIKSKEAIEAAGLTRSRLVDLVKGDEIDRRTVARLLDAMKGAVLHPVKSPALGVIGRDHFAAKFEACGAEMPSFSYKRVMSRDGLPSVIETAFAWCPTFSGRRIVTGVNWSPGINNPFRQLGECGISLDTVLERQRSGPDEPTALILHIACPKVSYTDRGKSTVIVAD